MSTPMCPVNTNKSTVSNVSIDSLITTEIDRMMYQIDPQQSDPIIPGAYDSVDFLEHCGKRPTEIIETDNNADLITPSCGKEIAIATNTNIKCDSYRDKLLEGINEKADCVVTKLAKPLEPAFQIPVRINGSHHDPKPANENFTGVSRKRTSRFYITNIDPSSTDISNTSCRVTDLGRTNVNKSIVFSDFMLRNNIIPVNASTLRDASSFTYIPTRTLLDYFLVSEELAGDVISCENIPEGTLSLTSDHLPVFLKLSIPYVCNSTNSCNNVWPSWRKASESSLGAYNELTNKIADELLDLPLCNLSDLDTLAYKLTDKLKDCANETIPSGSFNPKTKPYWSDEVKQAQTAERLARRKWINQGRPRVANFPSYVEYKSAKNEFRNRQRLPIMPTWTILTVKSTKQLSVMSDSFGA
ncbi:unnamed protein product [Mytilus edulis]|uniref:Endonuclease/exonuclease/phosphatase domain-containing protein n=1 Tax=Mytilus edulis TaxID=6550 RepID=A0A8S3USP3_MYTED|nr:unnamed protein product [Mytilus edulis]